MKWVSSSDFVGREPSGSLMIVMLSAKRARSASFVATCLCARICCGREESTDSCSTLGRCFLALFSASQFRVLATAALIATTMLAHLRQLLPFNAPSAIPPPPPPPAPPTDFSIAILVASLGLLYLFRSPLIETYRSILTTLYYLQSYLPPRSPSNGGSSSPSSSNLYPPSTHSLIIT